MSCPLAGHRIGLLQGEAKRKHFLATIAKTICYNIGMISKLVTLVVVPGFEPGHAPAMTAGADRVILFETWY